MKPVRDITQRVSALAEGPSHSTDQPRGKVHGQVKLAIISSKLVPENSATCKTEYTNTQQVIPVTVILSLLSRHARLCKVLGLFC